MSCPPALKIAVVVVIGGDTHLDAIHLAARNVTENHWATIGFLTWPFVRRLVVKWAQCFATV
jgi:hypothetical protein